MLATIAAALTGCGSSSTAHGPIVFGITAGNILSYRISIQPNGTVSVRNSQRTTRRHIPPGRVRQLEHEIQQAHLASRRCPGALPDFASHYIQIGDRTFTVHGGCEPPFDRVWNDLVRAVGPP